MAQPLWYVQVRDQTLGPFPAPQIQQYLLLGRLKAEDLISLDGRSWIKVSDSGQFDAVLQGLGRPEPAEADGVADWGQERQQARRRWLDERLDTQPLAPESTEQRGGEPVALAALRHDHAQTQSLAAKAFNRPPAYWIAAAALLVLLGVAAAVWYGQMKQPQPITAPLTTVTNCGSVPAPGVDWEGCDKHGVAFPHANLNGAKMSGVRLDAASLRSADLSYVDLSRASLRGADLSGANLTGAELSGADLTGADLSGAVLDYAILRGALIPGVRFSSARLGRAVWVDGRECAPGSLGGCG
jgi:Pentapeptide repeats (8 copies)